MKINLSNLHLDILRKTLQARIIECAEYKVQYAKHPVAGPYWSERQAEAQGVLEYIKAQTTVEGHAEGI